MAVVALKPETPAPWSERTIAALLARDTFGRDLVCPNCTYLGFESDLLVVHRTLRLIDVEIKISRADLKVDLEKRKWWREDWTTQVPQRHGWGGTEPARQRIEWPNQVWKHYYALPAELWKPELAEFLPAMSGLLLIHRNRVEHKQRAKPNPFTEPVKLETAMTIARLVSVRYWEHVRRIRADDAELERA